MPVTNAQKKARRRKRAEKAKSEVAAVIKQEKGILRQLKAETKSRQSTNLYQNSRLVTGTNRRSRNMGSYQKKLVKVVASDKPSISELVATYFDVVCNPFDCVNIVKIPDYNTEKSVVTKDFIMPSLLTLPAQTTDLAADGEAMGVLLVWYYGYNIFMNYGNTGDLPFYYDGTGNSIWQYGIYASVVNTDGNLTGGLATDALNVIPFTNYDTLYQNPDHQPEVNAPNAQVTAQRVISGGMRCTSQIEFVTNSSTPAISEWWSGMIKIQDLYNKYWITTSNINFDQFMAGSNANKYTNSQGTSMRINPFQQHYDEYLTVQETLGNWDNSSNMLIPLNDFSNHRVPFIYIKFNQKIAADSIVGTTSIFSFPVYFDALIYTESQLAQPSPFIMSPSPVDPQFEKWKKIMQIYPESMCRHSVSGHSFPSFFSGVNKFVNYAKNFLNKGTQLVDIAGDSFARAQKVLT